MLGDVETLVNIYCPSESDEESPKCNTAGCGEDMASGSEAVPRRKYRIEHIKIHQDTCGCCVMQKRWTKDLE